jgi:soluble lytic murein transglycosylase
VFVHTLETLVGRASAQPAASRHAARWLLAAAMAALLISDAVAAKRQPGVPAHRKTEAAHAKVRPAQNSTHSAASEPTKRVRSSSATSAVPLPRNRPALADLPPDVAAVRQALDLVRAGKLRDATALETSIGDPVARTLVEWLQLRHGDSEAGFDRYAAFIKRNPEWPSITLLRRRAEARLWQERRDPATVRDFVGTRAAGVMGELALARVLMGAGDRAGAEEKVRAAWRSGELSSATETAVLDAFPDVLTRADHAARMDRRLGAKDFGGAMRAAHRVGDDGVAIVKACAAAEANASKAGKLLDAVPGSMRDDPGYALCRVHALMRHGDVAAAAKVAIAVPDDAVERTDTDEWWRERRVLARKLLDLGDAKTAYEVVLGAAVPANPYYRAERYFMSGWIALRFRADPATALGHFAHIDDATADPIVLARAAYWRGRAVAETGDVQGMRAQYEAAARHPTAYYGQLARAQLGLGPVELRPLPSVPEHSVASDLLHAVEILYAIGEPDLVRPFATDLAERGNDAATIAALAQLTASHDDASATLLIGKTALARGLALDLYAFPDIGLPRYAPIGPAVDRSVVFSVARTESAFDQRDKSAANAVGLMQVTPEAGRDTAKRLGVAYDWKRIVSDPVYNTQMGAGEIAALLKEYRGSFIMTFAGYNAGRGRVKEWVAHYGDPRDPKVDAVDWVERIPIAETRNYVQRVMENLAVYRVRFGDGVAAAEPSPRSAATIGSRAE